MTRFGHHEIADLCARQMRGVGEPIERGAKTADNVNHVLGFGCETACDRNRIVSAHNRPEIARRGKLVVQAPIGDEIGRAVAFLAVDHTGEINSRFANEISAELQNQFG